MSETISGKLKEELFLPFTHSVSSSIGFLYPEEGISVLTKEGTWTFYERKDFTMPNYPNEPERLEDGFCAVYKANLDGDNDSKITTMFSGSLDNDEDLSDNVIPIAEELTDKVLEQGLLSFPPRQYGKGTGAHFGFNVGRVVGDLGLVGMAADYLLASIHGTIPLTERVLTDNVLNNFLYGTGLAAIQLVAQVKLFGNKKLENFADRLRTRNLPDRAQNYLFGKESLQILMYDLNRMEHESLRERMYKKMLDDGKAVIHTHRNGEKQVLIVPSIFSPFERFELGLDN